MDTSKSALRSMMESRRAAAFAQNPQASSNLRDHFLKVIIVPAGTIVASYSARGSEMNPAPLADALRNLGHRIALPVMAGRDKPLVFRLHEPEVPLIINKFGISEPGSAALIVEPDVLLVPLLAFDRQHNRLGTGGGYYDRTLAALRERKAVQAIGIGFSCQEHFEIPVESHDIALDRIATELHVF